VVDGRLALDAGSLTRGLGLEAQRRLRHVLLTHGHLDHVKDLAFLADNLFAVLEEPLVVHALPETLAVLREDLLNGRLWFDPTLLPDPERPLFRYQPVMEETPFQVGPYRCLAIRTAHPAPNAAFLIRHGAKGFCFTGDTGPTERLWERLSAEERLDALLIEVSFPDRLAEVARLTGHLTPASLAEGLARWKRRGAPVFLTHLKPEMEGEIRAEVEALGLAACRFLEQGETLRL